MQIYLIKPIAVSHPTSNDMVQYVTAPPCVPEDSSALP